MAPTLKAITEHDLQSPERLLWLHGAAQQAGLIGRSEHDRLMFVAAAMRARRVATANAPGLFMTLVRRKHWHYASQADEEAARRIIHESLCEKAAPRVARPSPVPAPDDVRLAQTVWQVAAAKRVDPMVLVREIRPAWGMEHFRALLRGRC